MANGINRALVAAGNSLNLLSTVIVDPTLSPTAATNFPASGLSDGDTGNPMIFSAAAASATITYDMNIIDDGGFEDGIGDWQTDETGATTAITIDSSNQRTGSNCVKLYNDPILGASSYVWKDIYVRAGQVIYFEVYSKGSPAGGLLVSFPDNGVWWSEAAGDYTTFEDYSLRFLANTGSYTGYNVTITAPSWYDSGGNDLVLMRVAIAQISETNTTIYVDDLIVVPAWNVCSIHGYKIEPGSTVSVRSSTDNFSSVTNVQGSLEINHPWPAYLALDDPCTDRYFRIRIAGPGYAANAIGELVVCYATELLKAPSWPLEYTIFDSKLPGEVYGETVLFSNAATPIVTLNMNIKYMSANSFAQVRDELVNRANGNLMLAIPDDSDDVVVFGQAQELAVFDSDWETSSSVQFLVVGSGNCHFLS